MPFKKFEFDEWSPEIIDSNRNKRLSISTDRETK